MTCDVRLGRVLGLPAVFEGKVVGHVERAIPDESGKAVEGFVIRRGLGGAKWVDCSTVKVLGEVSLVVGVQPARNRKGNIIAMTAVKDEGGLTLGRVTDWWISPNTLDITALEVSLGPLEDLTGGRRKVCQWTIQPGEEGMQVLIPREAWE